MNIQANKIELHNQTYDVFGMWCSSCAKALEKHVVKIEGVEQVKVDFATAQVTVKSRKPIDQTKLSQSVSELGYSLLKSFSNQTDDDFKTVKQSYLIRNSVVSFLSMWSLALSLAFYAGGTKGFLWASSVLGFVGAAYGLIPILKMAYISLKTSTITFDLLVAVANLSLIIVSTYHLLNDQRGVFFESIVMTISVVLWSRYIDLLTRFKLRSHVLKNLIDTSMDVEVEISGEWKTNNTQSVREGRIVRIKNDQQIPYDGNSLSDETIYVDNSHITGESTLVRIENGDQVYAGAILKSSFLKLKVSKTIGNRQIDQLFTKSLDLTQNANQPWLKNILEKWSFAALVLSVLLFFIKFIFYDQSLVQSIEASGILLLVTCPCALIIIEPLTKLWIQKTSLGDQIYLNPSKLNRLEKPLAFVFDKTGTLIKTNSLTSIIQTYTNKCSRNEIEYLIASACFQHPHPLTKKIISQFEIDKLDLTGERTFLVNKGVTWITKKGDEIKVGSKSWLNRDFNQELNFDLGLSINGVVHAGLSFENQISGSDLCVLKALKKKNYSLFLLTGDHSENTSKMLGLDLFSEVRSSQNPEEKGSFIDQLKQEFSVIYVGDGINDLIAHAKADISIYLSDLTKSTTSISQSSAVCMPNDSLSKLDGIVQLIKSFYSRQRIAFLFGLTYNLILIPMAMYTTIHPLIAVISMVLSTSLITFISTRKYKI